MAAFQNEGAFLMKKKFLESDADVKQKYTKKKRKAAVLRLSFSTAELFIVSKNI